MRRKTSMYMMVFLVLILVAVSTPLFAGAKKEQVGSAQPSEKIIWKAASASFKHHSLTKQYLLYIETINQRAEGAFEIQYVGGPDVIALKDLYQAVKEGVVDMAMHYPTWYADAAPRGTTLSLSQLSFEEEKERGLFELVREAHKKAGLYFIGNVSPSNSTAVIHLKDKIEKMEDLAGIRIATYSYPVPWMEALGINPVIQPVSDRYLAVDRGVADGMLWTYQEAASYKSWEVAPYFIDHPVTRSVNAVVVNLDSWNQLPDNMKELMTDAYNDLAPVFFLMRKQLDDEGKETLLENGSKPIYFSDAQAKEYVDLFYDTMWDKLSKTYPGEISAEFRAKFR